MVRRIVETGSSINPREIDKGAKNIWKWEWLEREVCGELVGCHIGKLAEKGKAYCQLSNINKDLIYTQCGLKALEQHIKLKIHQDNLKIGKTNYSLLGNVSIIFNLLLGKDGSCHINGPAPHFPSTSFFCPNFQAEDWISGLKKCLC